MNYPTDQLSLLDIEANEQETSVLHPGQWRLARMELVNWGTFDGYFTLPVDRRGLLITGPSGSGKSTLLDAITTVLTPPRSRELNAAAKGDGVKGQDRTISSYIRGAWRHEADESGEISNSYLRQKGAVWSGLLLRYECGRVYTRESSELVATINLPINLIVLYNQKAGSTSREGLKELYAVIRGDHKLQEFEPYAKNGIDLRKFNRDYKEMGQAFSEHSQFANTFCRALGIRTTQTLELLHKTQAAKNFGSLDDLFRKFMLEEPPTFDQADEAAEQFSALSRAYDGVVAQRKQMQELEPLLALEKAFQKSQNDNEKSARLEEVLDGFTERLMIDCLKTEEEQLLRESDLLEETVREKERVQRQARQVLEKAQTLFSQAGGQALTTAELDMATCEREVTRIANAREQLAADLTCTNIDSIPSGYSEWEAFVRMVKLLAEQSTDLDEARRDENSITHATVERLKRRIEETETELSHLRSRHTNIPANLHQVRVEIAEHLGVSMDELPFMAELVAVKEEEHRWQGAIERLMGHQARTLLVASRYIKAVTRYIESAHLGIRLELESIPMALEIPLRSVSDSSVVRKIVVKQHKDHPEYTDWVNAKMREQFDYVCVDSPSQLEGHVQALSIAGQIKRKNRYIKDDRYKINDKSRWILGDTNDEKTEQFEHELLELHQLLARARKEADLAIEQMNRTRDLVRVSEVLNNAQWETYDAKTAQEDLRAATLLYEQIQQGNKEIAEAEKLRNEADQRRKEADEELQEAKIKQSLAANRAKEISQAIEKHLKRIEGTRQVLKEDSEHLSLLFKKEENDYRVDIDTIQRVSRKVLESLHKEGNRTLQAMQSARGQIERTLHDFKLSWPAVTANLSEDFADKDAYLAIFQSIKANGLPEYEQRFMQVLQDFSQDQVTVLASTIRGAYREVKEKLAPVNRSLKMSEYSKGIHLQIEVRDCKGRQVTDFLAELQTITQGTWSDEDLESAESRYLRTAAIIRRFKSDENVDKNWKRSCLDTRLHVSFIAREIDREGNVEGVYGSDAGLSGGQKQKLVIFCLAAALRYQLADEDRAVPSFGTVVLDEAFDKADHRFTASALDIFEVFGFHMVLATPLKHIQILEKYIGAIASVNCQESRRSSFQLVTIEEAQQAEGSEHAEP